MVIVVVAVVVVVWRPVLGPSALQLASDILESQVRLVDWNVRRKPEKERRREGGGKRRSA